MRLIKPYYEILPEIMTIQDMKRNIELGGRVCYKSEDKITEDSADKFINTLIKSGHTSVLEHGTVYIMVNKDCVEFFEQNPYSHVNYETDYEWQYAVTTNYRVLIENNLTNWLEHWSGPTEYHEKRYTVRFICDRGVSHEFVRHRVFSFSQESTRYCNYSKDKFGNECTFIIPSWFKNEQGILEKFEGYTMVNKMKTFDQIAMEMFGEPYNAEEYLERMWLFNNILTENNYYHMSTEGWIPQQARSVLPNSLKTELVMTGFAKDWKHFFSLRDANAAHPQARELAKPLHDEFKNLGYV